MYCDICHTKTHSLHNGQCQNCREATTHLPNIGGTVCFIGNAGSDGISIDNLVGMVNFMSGLNPGKEDPTVEYWAKNSRTAFFARNPGATIQDWYASQ